MAKRCDLGVAVIDGVKGEATLWMNDVRGLFNPCRLGGSYEMHYDP